MNKLILKTKTYFMLGSLVGPMIIGFFIDDGQHLIFLKVATATRYKIGAFILLRYYISNRSEIEVDSALQRWQMFFFRFTVHIVQYYNRKTCLLHFEVSKRLNLTELTGFLKNFLLSTKLNENAA